MWGLCQNVEIIHQHHHHFYQLILPNKARNRALSSKTQSLNDTPSPEYLPASARLSPLGILKEPSPSTFYRSKRAYLIGTQPGIEVLSRKQDHSFQLSRINLQTAPQNQQQIYPQKQGPYMPLTPRQTPQQTHQQIINRMVINDEFTPVKKANPNQISVSLDESIKKSTPTACRNPNSHQASLKASHYFNLHQLKQSTINFKNASVCQTQKKHRENPLSINHAISLSTPAETGTISKNNYHQSSEIYLRDNDSITTKKEKWFLSAFKTEQMFDDAKSIISMESLQHQQPNIDESIIISRAMDYFTNISHKRQLPDCCLYLARDNRINWLVSVRQFEFKHEQAAMKEAKLHGLLSHSSQEGREWPVLALYRVMMEGSGLSKTIFFIQEPFENLLNEHIHTKKTYYKAVPSAFNHFLHDLAEQALKTLSVLAEKRLFLMQNLEQGDFTIVNGIFKLHSLCKFQLAGLQQSQSKEEVLAYVQKLKSAIIQIVIFS